MRQTLAIALLAVVALAALADAADTLQAPATDITIQASDISQACLHGAWTLALDPTSSGGVTLATWTSPAAAGDARTAPLATPADYFDVDFAAAAGIPYRIWLHLRAHDDASGGDSVWVQFSDAQVDGRLAYLLGTTSGLLVSLQSCAGCAASGWGWQDSSWRFGQQATVTFATTGVHRLRIQARAGGVQVDRIVVSSGAYLKVAPGARE